MSISATASGLSGRPADGITRSDGIYPRIRLVAVLLGHDPDPLFGFSEKIMTE
jgi:hypothetical protein